MSSSLAVLKRPLEKSQPGVAHPEMMTQSSRKGRDIGGGDILGANYIADPFLCVTLGTVNHSLGISASREVVRSGDNPATLPIITGKIIFLCVDGLRALSMGCLLETS